MNQSKSESMKTAAITLKGALLTGSLVLSGAFMAMAQDGIYDDIYQAPSVGTSGTTTPSGPLDGYSTFDQDDYYQPQNNNISQNPANSEQYVDENGNTYITNNYYGDDDYDYFYASRINRFHRPIYGFGYYDPFYTNMYWYNYDPFFFGTSIYAGWGWGGFYRPWGWDSWGWGGGWGLGWNSWGGGWGGGLGWNSWGWGGGWGSPYCFGGWGGGWGGYGMGYNQGYWNGYYDGLAMGGGYYNTFDQNSGIYYGHRGGTAGTPGSGVRGSSLGDRYNRAAAEGIVSHANRSNILQTADARPVVGKTPSIDRRPDSNVRDVQAAPVRNSAGATTAPVRNQGDVRKEPAPVQSNPTRVPINEGRDVIRQEGGNVNAPQRTPQQNTQGVPQRTPQNGFENVPQRNPQQNTQGVPQRTPQNGFENVPQRNPQQNTQGIPQRTPQNGFENVPQRNPQTAPQRTPQTAPQRTPQSYGNRMPQRPPQRTEPTYQAPARNPQQPSRDVYRRGGTPNTQSPVYNAPSRPDRVPSRNYGSPQQPSRDFSPSRPQRQPDMPQRTAPSRNDAPVRDFSPQRSAPSPSRSVSPSPSRGGGGFSSPSRGGSAPSGGRRGG
jgi:hypothetical protein